MKLVDCFKFFAASDVDCLKNDDATLLNAVRLSVQRGDGHAEQLPPIILHDENPEPIANMLYGVTIETDKRTGYQIGEYDLPCDYDVVGVAMLDLGRGFARAASILHAGGTVFLHVCEALFSAMEDELFYRDITSLERDWVKMDSVTTLRKKIGVELHNPVRMSDTVINGASYHLVRGAMPFLHLRHAQSTIEEQLLRAELSRHDAHNVIELPFEITAFKTVFQSGPGHSSGIDDEDSIEALRPFMTRLAMQLVGIESSADEVTNYVEAEQAALTRLRDAASGSAVRHESLANFICPSYAKTVEIKCFDDFGGLSYALFGETVDARPCGAAEVRDELKSLAKRVEGTIVIVTHDADLANVKCEKIADQTIVELTFDMAARYALVNGVRFVILDTEATEDVVFKCTSGAPIPLAPKKDAHELLIDVNRRVLRLEQKVDSVLTKLDALVSKKRKAENSPSLQ